MRTQCDSKLLEFEGHCSGRRRLVEKKLIFFRFFFVAVLPTPCPFVDIFFPLVSFFVALHGPLSSLFQPLGVPWRINLFPP